VFSGVPQATVLWSVLCNVFINDLCNSIKPSSYCLLADDIKILHTISSATYCTLLQSHIDSIQGWCAANGMKLNIDKTRVITFRRKLTPLIIITNCVININLYRLHQISRSTFRSYTLDSKTTNASNRSLHLYASVVFPSHSLQLCLRIWASKITHFIS
jgi:hypothetical protein